MQNLQKIKEKILGTSLKRKTKILILNTLIGLFLIAGTTIVSLVGLKYDYDSTFLNQEQKLKQLIVIQNIYSDLLTEFIAQDPISQKVAHLRESWKEFNQIQEEENYGTKFKDFYMQLFSNYQNRLDELSRSEEQIAKIISDEIPDKITNFSLFKDTALNLNLLLHRAIELRIEIINVKKKATNSIFITSLAIVGVLVAIIISTTFFFSQIIISSIRDLHHSLEAVIFKKTKELRELNEDLQQTIQQKIKESRQKDQIMYQQARLASIGEMIQNIAHQWRQPLNSLMLLIQSFQSKSENGKLTHEFICNQTKDALRIAKNMSDTIENFRNFFQPHTIKQEFCIQDSIEDSLHILSSNLKNNNIDAHNLSHKHTMFFGYENAFTQVILNLVNNAKDAIISENVSNGIIEIEIEESEEEIKIITQDNAGGIKLKEIEKIFEPYFTTKHKSVGTGIGLYMVKQIVENQMEGKIFVKNASWISKITKQKYFGAIFEIILSKTNTVTQGE